MTVNEIMGDPPPLETLRGLWIVMDEPMADTVVQVQDEGHLFVRPIPTADGRYALCADMLTEVIGGIYQTAFLRLLGHGFGSLEVVDDVKFPELPDPDGLDI